MKEDDADVATSHDGLRKVYSEHGKVVGTVGKASAYELLALAADTAEYLRKKASDSDKKYTDRELSAVTDLVKFLIDI
ncbi:hypothetical protein [Dickeya dianthicola]|uniref:hypothetical protein n=1 Tax=Dickeya dianthicola TaxID=204039 RepID=UPI001F61285E|nr:hypothetical protein [Dickeya dianthicola]MCI4204261.1 hypothetical protein [Dickeya dianthicola]MCI4210857.1 hypothetical protein [Dickeya dianthicola]MCI4217794.1 hypothetical protein [Dickeya dianthicola]MCI4226198.1 hypothetical protein [Dickeya dianthicola]